MRKHWKKIVLIILLLILIILAIFSCSSGIERSEDPGETTLPIETTQPVDETTVPVETTEPTEPEETVPETTEAPTTEPPATEPLVTDPPATEAPKVQHTHSYSSKRKEPTCSADGVTTYTCTGCGYSYTEEIPATGHVWSSWTVIVAATSENEGSQSRTCGNCGYEQTQTIAKLPVVTEPPETEPPTTKPVATEPPQTEPPVTEAPVATEPPATEPTKPAGCNHSWEMIYHLEEGHYGESFVVCKCGFSCKTEAEWAIHAKSVGAEEALINHTSWHTENEYIVDSQEFYEWVCSKCGASTTTQP